MYAKVVPKMSITFLEKSGKYSNVKVDRRNFGVPLSTQLNVGSLMKISLKRWSQSVILDLSRNGVIDTCLRICQYFILSDEVLAF